MLRIFALTSMLGWLLLGPSATALSQYAASDATPLAMSEATPPAAPVAIVGADIAWMLVSSAMVLMMTAPGLALFYGGLVRKKNVLSVMMQCVYLMGLMSLVWAAYGYSLVFSGDVGGGMIGDFGFAGMQGVSATWDGTTQTVPQLATVPRLVHFIFQMMFFIITPGLICGAFAERMKFSSMVLFSVLWGTLVYCPVAHWVWSDFGWCSEYNPQAAYKTLDFAGGTVVHITSGFSALVCALMLGRRVGFGQEPMPPHNLTYTCIGAALLWVGWFGFNAGSAGAANFNAVNAFVATHLAAASGTIAWAGMEWMFRGKPSILGACSGAVAGLVCVTPACGSCSPFGGVCLGIIAGGGCYYACTKIKNHFGYDDSLDAFGVHGIGGLLGAIFTGVFATQSVKPGFPGLLEGNPEQVVAQAVGAGAAIVWSVVVTAILVKVVDAVVGLRVTQKAEVEGLDIGEHGEEGYIFV
ncbi:MAG TPA: ammonium transporter [Planctomycetaceae bacterium]|nr:ammonium transporter [Planctomycetaceae bacterium]